MFIFIYGYTYIYLNMYINIYLGRWIVLLNHRVVRFVRVVHIRTIRVGNHFLTEQKGGYNPNCTPELYSGWLEVSLAQVVIGHHFLAGGGRAWYWVIFVSIFYIPNAIIMEWMAWGVQGISRPYQSRQNQPPFPSGAKRAWLRVTFVCIYIH